MWRDTPAEKLIVAERLDGSRVRFSELRCGEIVRFVAADGHYVDPVAAEYSDSYFRVCEEPRRADGTETMQDFGWCVPVEEVPAGEVKTGLN